jgi:hypothetical protein
MEAWDAAGFDRLRKWLILSGLGGEPRRNRTLNPEVKRRKAIRIAQFIEQPCVRDLQNARFGGGVLQSGRNRPRNDALE